MWKELTCEGFIASLRFKEQRSAKKVAKTLEGLAGSCESHCELLVLAVWLPHRVRGCWWGIMGRICNQGRCHWILRPVHGWNLTVCPCGIVWDPSQDLLSGIAGISCSLWIPGDGSFGKGRPSLREQPSLPRPDDSKLQIAEAQDWHGLRKKLVTRSEHHWMAAWKSVYFHEFHGAFKEGLWTKETSAHNSCWH